MTPEEPTPKPGIRYGGLMCPHGMVRGACAICRNPPASPKLEAESVEPEPAWIGTRLWLIEKNAALRAEVERLKGIIMGTSAESRVTLGVNLRRYWPAEAQVMLGRMLFAEDVPALRAELAAERAAREKAEAEQSANNSAFVEMNAVFEAVMKAIRLRIAEERVEELENEIVSWRGAQAVRFLGDAGDRDAYPIRREAEIKLNEVAASILAARSAKGGANG